MRNRPWFRTLASVLAIWFPLIAGEPGVLHPCPMHGAGAAVVSALTGVTTHASHHSAATNHHGAPSHDHHDCTCINGCSVSLTAAGAPQPATIDVALVEVRAPSALSTAPTLARPAPEYARPYTTGPPSA
jgi:hypothetical protein